MEKQCYTSDQRSEVAHTETPTVDQRSEVDHTETPTATSEAMSPKKEGDTGIMDFTLRK